MAVHTPTTPAVPPARLALTGRLRRLWHSMWRQGLRLLPPPTARVDGQRAVVTGGNGGIGLATARGLLERGAQVEIACRNPERARAAVEQLRAGLRTPERVSAVACDLADLESVAACADGLLRGRPIDILVCNAGIWPQRYAQTAQGYEIAFGVNVLGHHLLVERLAQGGGLAQGGRVILVTGDIYVLVRDCAPGYRYRGPLGGQWAYCRSKLGNLWQRAVFAERYPEQGWYAVHPGVVASGLFQAGGGLGEWCKRQFFIRPEAGAATSLRCATEPGIEPGYHHNTLGLMRLGPGDPALDVERARRLDAQCRALIARSTSMSGEVAA